MRRPLKIQVGADTDERSACSTTILFSPSPVCCGSAGGRPDFAERDGNHPERASRLLRLDPDVAPRLV